MARVRGIKMILAGLFFLFGCPSAGFSQAGPGDLYPDWSPGYLDIHHINTGKGECSLYILPDGTTMLVDAGATARPKPRVMDARPDDTRTPGEWITRYITHMLRNFPEKKLDYIWLTHFHEDHFGAISMGRSKSASGGYVLSGLTEVGDRIPFGKVIDRGWPDYDWPRSFEKDANVQNYIRFVRWNVENKGVAAERFRVGANDQFTLLKNPGKYPGFEIRNVAANGEVWTGVGNNVRNHFPALKDIPKSEIPSENQCSSAIRVSYGRFDYFNGADLVHAYQPGRWQDIETPAGLAVGPVDVCVANHHATDDAMGENFLQAVRPRVHIVQTWIASQPAVSALRRMQSKKVYPGERDIFATNVMEETRVVIGTPLQQLKSQQGHIVIRVEPGGDTYRIYVLDDAAETFRIKAVFGPYESL